MIGAMQASCKRKLDFGESPKMNKIGTRGFCVFVNEFKGEPKVHIRKVIENEEEEGDVIFTKWGVALEIKEFEELKQLLPTINAAVKKIEQRLEGRDKTMKKLLDEKEKQTAETMLKLNAAKRAKLDL